MKKCLWIIRYYFDDEKEKLLFKREYKNIMEIQEDFNLGKSFLYECCNEDKYKSNSRKSKIIQKYKRLTIEKRTFDKQNNYISSIFKV